MGYHLDESRLELNLQLFTVYTIIRLLKTYYLFFLFSFNLPNTHTHTMTPCTTAYTHSDIIEMFVQDYYVEKYDPTIGMLMISVIAGVDYHHYLNRTVDPI